jgi:putative hydrolase of the HAD superfamily
MIHALLFDMGNVLIHFSHERMYQQIGQLVGRGAVEVRHACEQAKWLARCDVRPVSDEEMASEVESLFGVKLDPAALWHALSDIFWPNRSIEPIVMRLASLGLPMVMVSNTCSAHIRWVTGRFSVLEFFPHKVLSYEVGASKPSSVIFAAASRAAGCSPAECLFIDDTAINVDAARQLGFDAVRYENSDMLVRSLQERGMDGAMKGRGGNEMMG